MNPGTIVAVATGIGFLLIGLWVLLFGFKVKYPAGDRRDVTKYGFTSTTIVHAGMLTNAELGTLAARCHEAIYAMIETWAELPSQPWIGQHLKTLDGFCCCFFPSTRYDSEWQSYKLIGKGSNAVRIQLKRPIGSGPLATMVRADVIANVLRTGDPIGHEALHALWLWDPLHARPDIWERGAVEWAKLTSFEQKERARRLGILDIPYPPDATVEARAYAKLPPG